MDAAHAETAAGRATDKDESLAFYKKPSMEIVQVRVCVCVYRCTHVDALR